MSAAPKGGLELLAGLERAGAIDETSLVIDDPDFPFDQWAALGTFLGEAKSRLSFYIGDWLNFGAGIYGDRYAQAMEATGLSYETLTNYASVCRNVVRKRRRADLKFGHHQEVSKLEPAEQKHWLGQAAENEWKRSDLRDALRRARNPEPLVEVLPAPDVLSPRALSVAAGALAAAGAVLSAPEEAPTARRLEAVRALEQAGETLAAVSRVASLRDLARELLSLAEPDSDPAKVRVPKENLDRIADVVLDRPTDEGGTK